MTRPIPLRPDPRALTANNVNVLVRAAIAKAMVRLDPRCDEREHLRARWPNDPTPPLIRRAAMTSLVRTAPIDRAARIIDSRCQREGGRFSFSFCLAQHQPASSEVDTSGAALTQKTRRL
jgi:hypothetical protein